MEDVGVESGEFSGRFDVVGVVGFAGENSGGFEGADVYWGGVGLVDVVEEFLWLFLLLKGRFDR